VRDVVAGKPADVGEPAADVPASEPVGHDRPDFASADLRQVEVGLAGCRVDPGARAGSRADLSEGTAEICRVPHNFNLIDRAVRDPRAQRHRARWTRGPGAPRTNGGQRIRCPRHVRTQAGIGVCNGDRACSREQGEHDRANSHADSPSEDGSVRRIRAESIGRFQLRGMVERGLRRRTPSCEGGGQSQKRLAGVPVRPRCDLVSSEPTTHMLKNPPICSGFTSPLPDSNRRPPPYHGGFDLLLSDAGTALASALSLQCGWFIRSLHPFLEGP